MNKVSCTEIGGIGNAYGGLSVKAEDGKFFWSIENFDGDNWEEIPKTLYDSLMRYERKRMEDLRAQYAIYVDKATAHGQKVRTFDVWIFTRE